MIDIHSHFLPKIDDGADSISCSLEMLTDLKKQGVNTVVSTSHFYGFREEINSFLDRREKSYNELLKNIGSIGDACPEIILGAEVALVPDLPKMNDIEKLCIGNSNSILIELPYNGYYEWIPYAIFEITSRYNLVPILAHFERFCINKSNLEQYLKLLELEVKVQINTESLLNRKSFKMVKKLFKMGAVDVIGSDAHNMDSRRSTFSAGAAIIEKKFGDKVLKDLNSNSKKLIGLS